MARELIMPSAGELTRRFTSGDFAPTSAIQQVVTDQLSWAEELRLTPERDHDKLPVNELVGTYEWVRNVTAGILNGGVLMPAFCAAARDLPQTESVLFKDGVAKYKQDALEHLQRTATQEEFEDHAFPDYYVDNLAALGGATIRHHKEAADLLRDKHSEVVLLMEDASRLQRITWATARAGINTKVPEAEIEEIRLNNSIAIAAKKIAELVKGRTELEEFPYRLMQNDHWRTRLANPELDPSEGSVLLEGSIGGIGSGQFAVDILAAEFFAYNHHSLTGQGSQRLTIQNGVQVIGRGVTRTGHEVPFSPRIGTAPHLYFSFSKLINMMRHDIPQSELLADGTIKWNHHFEGYGACPVQHRASGHDTFGAIEAIRSLNDYFNERTGVNPNFIYPPSPAHLYAGIALGVLTLQEEGLLNPASQANKDFERTLQTTSRQ